jgi:hypothetical protein
MDTLEIINNKVKEFQKIRFGKPGELDLKLFNEITAIHYGEKEDTHNWLMQVEKKGVEVG